MGGGLAPNRDTKTVVVLGAAYGGARAAQVLAGSLPEGWTVILIDRNSHANHVYVMPRYAVLPGHEYKAFIPYNKVFLVDPPKPTHIHLYAQIVSLRPHHVKLSRSFPELGFPTDTIAFDYAIYALGSHLPPPLNLWRTSESKTPLSETKVTAAADAVYTGLKTQASDWFKERQVVIKDAPTVLVVGGGALGIQFATDIKSVYPEKEVTLLHSRLRLLPRFGEGMHDEIKSSCESMGIKLILGERLDLGSIENGQAKSDEAGRKIVRTVTGREIAADLLLLCTGQVPNTGILKTMDPSTVSDTTGLVHILRTMQVYSPAPNPPQTGESALADALKTLSVTAEQTIEQPKATSYPHIFAIGDAADAFGAIPAGHNAYSQGEVASRNVIRLIKASESNSNTDFVPEPLEKYTPGPPAIKVSLGLTRSVYQVGPSIGTKDDGVPDLQAALIWPFFGIKVEKEEDMIP